MQINWKRDSKLILSLRNLTKMFPEFADIHGHVASGMEQLINYKPWLYFIASYSQKFIYIGETNSRQSIVQRISEHFLNSDSSLKKNLVDVLNKQEPTGPFLVIGYSLDSESEEFEAKRYRLAIESQVQFYVSQKLQDKGINNYNIISNVSWVSESYQERISDMAEKIAEESVNRLEFQKKMNQSMGLRMTFLKIE